MAPKSSFCAEKERLLDAYVAVGHHGFNLQDREVKEVAKRGEGSDTFDLALKEARRRRDASKTACIVRLSGHGC